MIFSIYLSFVKSIVKNPNSPFNGAPFVSP